MNPELNPLEKQEKIPLKDLHPDFKIELDAVWMWNKNPANRIDAPDQKIKFLFNETDASKLDACPSIAKIGYNHNPETAQDFEYIGVIYGDRESSEEIRSFANAFDSVTLIEGLAPNWRTKENSIITKLK